MKWPRDRWALLAAALTCVVWAVWVGSESHFATIHVVGPLVFWFFPVLIAVVLWSLTILLAPRAIPFERRILGATNGIVAVLLGLPLSVASRVIYEFGLIGPFLFVILEPFVMSLGLLAMFGLYREAFRGMNAYWGPEAAGRRTTG
ncbi:MAG TPA: hypothetical protein VGK54_05960 [Chloroflexota bacterium]